VAYMAMNCLAHCARHDANCALQVLFYVTGFIAVLVCRLTSQPGMGSLPSRRLRPMTPSGQRQLFNDEASCTRCTHAYITPLIATLGHSVVHSTC